MSKLKIQQEMKRRRGSETLILFHSGEYFEAYYDDAQKISDVIGAEIQIIDSVPTITIPEKEQEHTTNQLLDNGYAVCVSSMIDREGNFVAQINQIEDE